MVIFHSFFLPFLFLSLLLGNFWLKQTLGIPRTWFENIYALLITSMVDKIVSESFYNKQYGWISFHQLFDLKNIFISIYATK